MMLCLFLLVYYSSLATCSEVLSRHKRTWIIDSFSIEEGYPGPFPYELGEIIVDRKYQVYFHLFGEGVDEEPKGVISIDKESGMVSVHKALDYEERTTLSLRFEARKADSSIDTKLGVEISILDINDNPPLFYKDLYEINIDEKSAQGSHLLAAVAYDRDQRGTPNSTFHFELKSVSPDLPDTEFFIDESGVISFKGCLDHEVAEKFTVLLEAKDHGEVVSLSSSTTVVIHVQDANNHLPTISGQTGSGKVREDESGGSPMRLHVTDKDTPNSPAWRARYTIQGDEGEHFKIETDPDTNDGILTVVKPLDFEEGAHRELSISVENEAPYFSCKVEEKTSSGLWKVNTTEGVAQRPSVKLIIEIEDANDPPLFSVMVKEVMLEENTAVGTSVTSVTAVDPDSSHSTDFVYKIGSDPAGWVTVDPHTGDITTVKTPDRESPHVVNGLYTVILHAVDFGIPPMTGTATLNIHIADQNDNVPELLEDNMDVCVSDSPTTSSITASDLDDNPFGGPFSFKLLGDVKGKWKLNPSYGFTAGLVKEPGVYSGPHTVYLKISDMQGKSGAYNLSVNVCECSETGDCRGRRETTTKASSGAIGIMFASLFLLLFLLLMLVTISCKKQFVTLQTNESSGETLLESNIENPGTDCEVTAHKHLQTNQAYISTFVSNTARTFISNHFEEYRSENHSSLFSTNWNQRTWNAPIAAGYHHTQQIGDMSTMHFLHTRNASYVSDSALQDLLHLRLSSIKETEEGLLDYQPHLYADEGDSDNHSELEDITIPDDDSFQKALQGFDPKFNQLASICKPTNTEQVFFGTNIL
ncbi:cadherin-like protein 26 [Pempheris klunzingeri]|uniref:cadherin-like protein 26 n=1 Tax=Pempheris klunzingeri TaxID=3127111 RepID=UPI0039818B3D